MEELEGADFDITSGRRELPNYQNFFLEVDCPDLRFFTLQLSDPHQGKEGIHTVSEKLQQLVLWAFHFYGKPLVLYTRRFYYRWVLEMKICSKRKTVAFFFFGENVTMTAAVCSFMV